MMRHYNHHWLLIVLIMISTATSGVLSQNPRILEHPQDGYIARNEPATLKCKAEGTPQPKITWYRNGERVVTANEDPSSHRMLLPHGELFFLSVIHNKNNKPDIGMYYCKAMNIHGVVVSQNATLKIAVLRDQFREHPKDMTVAVRERAVLRCRPPKGEPEPRVTWRKDSDGLQVTNRITILDDGDLVFLHAQKSDSGIYTCVAQNKAGEKESTNALFSVLERPKFLQTPEDVLIKAGEEALFHCKATGDPKPQIFWRRDEGQIDKNRGKLLDDKSLLLEAAMVEDEGLYVCQAENAVGTVEAVARLTVHAAPEILVPPTDKVVGIGRTATLRCEVTGNPSPSIIWSKDGEDKDLMFQKKKYGRYSVSNDGTLRISDVQKDDMGKYTCQAFSDAGAAKSSATIQVRDIGVGVNDHDSRPPPIIERGPQNQTLPIKGVAMLPCRVSGDPMPIVRWYRNKGMASPLKPLSADHRVTILDSGTLQISDLHLSDSAIYTCKALSETGETTWSAALSVAVPSNPSVVFSMAPDAKTLPGAPSKPMVKDTTDRSIHLQWRRNSREGASPITAFSVEYFSPDIGEGWKVAAASVPREGFTVRHLQADTSYMFIIRARNAHGYGMPSPLSDIITTRESRRVLNPQNPRTRLHLKLTRAELEERLSGTVVEVIKAEPKNSSHINIRWRVAKGNDVVQGFNIRYTHIIDPAIPEYGATQVISIKEPYTASYMLRGLRKFSWYEVRVQAFAGPVKSRYSEPVRVQTYKGANADHKLERGELEDRLSGTVVEVIKAEAKNSTHINIRWRVAKGNDVIQGFNIRYTHIIDPAIPEYGATQVISIKEPYTASYMLRGLREFAWYEVRVQAFTGPVKSRYSEPVRAHTYENVPTGPPENIIVHKESTTTVHIRWSLPKKEHRNGIITGYKIFLKANETRYDRKLSANASVFEMRVVDLEPGIRYRVQLGAMTQVGQGVLSQLIPVDPEEGSLMREPWFIGMLIGTIGGTLWLALCIFSIWLCRKRQHRKKLAHNGLFNAPVHKPEETTCGDHLLNGTLQNESGGPDLTSLLDGSKDPPPYADLNIYNVASSANLTPLRTFYNQGTASVPTSVGPYASTTIINAGNTYPKPVMYGVSAFRPIAQGSAGSSDSCLRAESGAGSLTDNSRVNTDFLVDTREGVHSPAGDSSGYTTDDNGMPVRRSHKIGKSSLQQKQALINWAELLPPPPEHPPPSEIGTPPGSMTHLHRYSPIIAANLPPEQLQMLATRAVISPAPGRTTRISPIPGTNPYASISDWPVYQRGHYAPAPHLQPVQRNLSYSDSEYRANSPAYFIESRSYSPQTHTLGDTRQYSVEGHHPIDINLRGLSQSPCNNIVPTHKLNNAMCVAAQMPYKYNNTNNDIRTYSPRAVYSEPERGPTPPTRVVPPGAHRYIGGGGVASDNDYRFFSDCEQGGGGVLMAAQAHRLHMGVLPIPPQPPAAADANSQNLPPRMESMSNVPMSHYSPRADSPMSENIPDYAESDVEAGPRPECTTPESSVGGDGQSVTASMLASWASVTDNSNTSCCSSVRSSGASSCDGTFLAEADFASAVAKAAEMSGLTMNANHLEQKGKRHHRRHRTTAAHHRATSPYSTDSNFSAVIHRPYPKSQRRRAHMMDTPANTDSAAVIQSDVSVIP